MLKKDIANVTKELPIYKHIAEVEIRKEEFNKTTTNKIKRQEIAWSINIIKKI